ncbi:paraquat-inducible protein A [Maribius pontilimi]|uniref:Paraquat-inducible protein A n=1 Tax=Palleronia pontilimi TaxID=1964209 RepID=A0A934MAZ2_9RHOB|nr:paraquat-inducible protein A [Palleronia pontilimi]MBJ3761163.1 paraquat-inducible protein A [Palleronia pontilimi]
MPTSDPSPVAQTSDPPAGELIACPQCDALYHAFEPGPGERLLCRRCHHVLIAPRTGAFIRTIALAITIMVLMLGATFFPFLRINTSGLSNAASVFDAALAFLDGGWMIALSFAVASLIVLIPVLRAMLVVYTLAPLAMGRAPLPGARTAFRWSEDLRPWSMAEIFVIGVAVALVKVSDLAKVEYGPAFWMFAALVIVIVLQEGLMCRWTIWKALETNRPS